MVYMSGLWFHLGLQTRHPFLTTYGTSASKGEALRSLLYWIADVVFLWRNLKHHKQHVRQVLGRLLDNGVKCHLSKVRIYVDYLGHKVVQVATALGMIKVKTIVSVLPPTNTFRNEEPSSEKSWSAVHKLGAAAGSRKLMGGTWCRPYLTQMPGGAGRMPGFFPVSGIILPDILSGT
jgi:hypothetical protein